MTQQPDLEHIDPVMADPVEPAQPLAGGARMTTFGRTRHGGT